MASDGFDRVVPRVTCPYCNRGPLPARLGPNVCSGCSESWRLTRDE